MREWRHNQAEHQWELGYWDEPRQEFVVLSWVTDEFIARTDRRLDEAKAAEAASPPVGIPPADGEFLRNLMSPVSQAHPS